MQVSHAYTVHLINLNLSTWTSCVRNGWHCRLSPNCFSAISNNAAMHGSLSIETCTMIFWPCRSSSSSRSSTSTIGTYPFETFSVSPPLPQRYHAGTVPLAPNNDCFLDLHMAISKILSTTTTKKKRKLLCCSTVR
jgi:hypothetical protein